MKQLVFSLVFRAAPASGQTDGGAAPTYGVKMPAGYRDWKLISVAHEEGNLHSFAAVLGNDTAIKAYREGTLPFPDGTIILSLHYRHVPSEENNAAGRSSSTTTGNRSAEPPWVHDHENHGLPIGFISLRLVTGFAA
jgi:hypothetical protein